MTSVRSELAAAVRAVNAAFSRLTPEARGRIEIDYDQLDADLDAAVASDDRDRAMVAIQTWRRHWLAVFDDNGGARSDPRAVAR